MSTKRVMLLFLLLVTSAACGGKPISTPTSSPLPPPAQNTPTPSPIPPTPTATATPVPAIILLFSTGYNVVLYDFNTSQNIALFQNMEVLNWQWSVSPDGRYLAYQLPAPLDGVSYLLDLTSRQVVGTIPYKLGLISWHPSGKAFLGYNAARGNWDLFRISDKTVVSTTIAQGVFSPDGTKLANFEGQQLQIHDVFLDASGQVSGVDANYRKYNLSLGKDTGTMNIRWSPDGKRLAFDAQKTKGDPINETFLFSVKADGSGLKKLVDSTTLDPEKVISLGYPADFAWSPDGSMIAFWASTLLPKEKTWVDPQIYVVKISGGRPEKITGDDSFPVGARPFWSPDGRLLFQSGKTDYSLNKLIISNADGSGKRILADDLFIWKYLLFLTPGMETALAGILAKPFTFTCATGWTRLEIGKQAIVAPGDPNRVRTEPKKGDNLVTQIPAGTVIQVNDGPVCADGMVFWKVNSLTVPKDNYWTEGWTAEGDGTEYWMEPYTP